jgi:hypothetical protein
LEVSTKRGLANLESQIPEAWIAGPMRQPEFAGATSNTTTAMLRICEGRTQEGGTAASYTGITELKQLQKRA